MIWGNEVVENWRGKKKELWQPSCRKLEERNILPCKYIDSYSQKKKRKKKYIDSYYVLVLICEYIVEPTRACSKERKLWKKKKIDVLTHCKRQRKKRKKETKILCVICLMKQRNKILVFAFFAEILCRHTNKTKENVDMCLQLSNLFVSEYCPILVFVVLYLVN